MFAMELRQARSPKHRVRLINRRQQGDLGEASAIEWLTSKGALVWLPLGHSPDVDLLAEIDGRRLGIQVKTSTQHLRTPDGHERWSVMLATNGGNQSWTGTTKTFDPAQADFVFVLVGDGRRWFIRARAVEGRRNVTLGGLKYSEFEVEPGSPIEHLVYGHSEQPSRIDAEPGEYPSGQRMRAVNASPIRLRRFESCLPHPGGNAGIEDVTKFERTLGRSGQAILRQKRQTTIPKRPFLAAGLRIGDRMRVRAQGEGAIVFERIERNEALFPVGDGATTEDDLGQ